MAASDPFDSVLDAARAGAEWAWERLFGDLDGVLRAYVRLQGGVDVDDLVGETWLQVARGIARFSGDEQAFRSWVFMIAHHRLIDERRGFHRRPVDLTGTSAPDDIGPAAESAESEALRRIGDEDLLRVLDALTRDQREVVLLRFVADMRVIDIAKVTGKPVGAVQAAQRRALRRIEKILGAGGTFSE